MFFKETHIDGDALFFGVICIILSQSSSFIGTGVARVSPGTSWSDKNTFLKQNSNYVAHEFFFKTKFQFHINYLMGEINCKLVQRSFGYITSYFYPPNVIRTDGT